MANPSARSESQDSFADAEAKMAVCKEARRRTSSASEKSVSAYPPARCAQDGSARSDLGHPHISSVHDKVLGPDAAVSLELLIASENGNSDFEGSLPSSSPEQSLTSRPETKKARFRRVTGSSGDTSPVPRACKRNYVKPDKQVFRHVKFTAPIDSVESDSIDSENIPPLSSSEVMPKVTKINSHQKFAQAHKGPGPNTFRKILKLEKRSSLEAATKSVSSRESQCAINRGSHSMGSSSGQKKMCHMRESIVVLERLSMPLPGISSPSADEKQSQKPSQVKCILLYTVLCQPVSGVTACR